VTYYRLTITGDSFPKKLRSAENLILEFNNIYKFSPFFSATFLENLAKYDLKDMWLSLTFYSGSLAWMGIGCVGDASILGNLHKRMSGIVSDEGGKQKIFEKYLGESIAVEYRACRKEQTGKDIALGSSVLPLKLRPIFFYEVC